MEQIQWCRSNVTENNEGPFRWHFVTGAEYWGTARKLLVAQLPLFCSIVDKSDVVFTDIHFSRHLTPGADATEGGINAIITDSTLVERQTNTISYPHLYMRYYLDRTGFKTDCASPNLDSIAIAHWYPHGHCYWRNASKSVEQRQTQTLAMLTSRHTGKTGKTPKREATYK